MSQQQEGEQGLPEWIMSYADMITILMAFFVVMYSVAGEKNAHKQEAVMESLRSWLGPLHRDPFRSGQGTRGTRGGYPGIAPRIPATGGADQPGDPRRGSDVSNWRAVQSLGGSVYLQAAAAKLTEGQQEQIERIAQLLAGKRQLIEMHCVLSPRLLTSGAPGPALDEGWSKCRLIADRLVERGIERQRLQIQIVMPASEPQDQNLLTDEKDYRIDVTLSDRFLWDVADISSEPAAPEPQP